MDNFNKLVSFILGLVVVIVFFAVVTGRLNLGKYTPSFAKKTRITPTPSPVSTVKIEEKTTPNYSSNAYYSNTYYSKTNPKNIPATGVPTFFIPSVVLAGASGWFLRKSGKK